MNETRTRTPAEHLRAAAAHIDRAFGQMNTAASTCSECGSHRKAEHFLHWKLHQMFKDTAKKLRTAADDLDDETRAAE